MRRGGAGILLVLSLVSGVGARAQTDSWVLAEQAMARLDYSAALKLSLETLAKRPQFIEARRMAAVASRELERYSDCLKYVMDIPATQLMSDDVGLLGECSSRGAVSQRVLSILQQQLANPDNAEMAGYWLGRHAYLREDYRAAERYLSPIQVLPDRLEKERQRMLERIRDVLRPQPVPTVSPLPSTPQVRGPAVAPPVARPVAQPSLPIGATRRSKNRNVERTGLYFDYDWYSGTGVDIGRMSKQVLLLPFTQTAYEESGKLSAIRDTGSSGSVAKPYGELSLTGEVGVRREIPQAGVSYSGGLRTIVGGAASGRSFYLYSLPEEQPYPTLALGAPTRGFEARLEPLVTVEVGKIMELSVAGGARLNVARADRRRQIYSVEPTAEFKSDRVRLLGGYRYERIYGVDGYAGLRTATGYGDLQILNLGVLALRSFDGYPLIRFSTMRSSSTTPSKEQLQFTVEEGDFFELNVVPRIRLDRFEVFGWFRYRSEAKRHFWSAEDASNDDLYNVDSLDEISKVRYFYWPTAFYEVRGQEFSGGVEWLPWNGLRVGAGVSSGLAQAYYKPAAWNDRRHQKDPSYYKKLIDESSEQWTRYFLSVQWAK
jgi:hypothetical protein